MDAISNADRFVILLRQKLAERAEAKRSSPTQPIVARQATGHDAVRAVTRRTAQAGAKDRKLQRTVVEQLLADRFGAALVNEARFQQIVDQVSDLMVTDPDLNDLFAEVITQIKASSI